MSLYAMVFSPTGGTQRVIDAFCADFPAPVVPVDLSDKHADFAALSLTPQDVCVIGVPSFGGRVPAAALARLAQMQGGGAAAVLVCVYGNRAFEDTLLELQDTVTACGFCVRAAVGAVAQHSIVAEYGASRPDAQDIAQLHAFSAAVQQALASGQTAAPALPGNRPYREFKGVPLKPKANKTCTQCGACARLCPVGAIPAATPAQTDNTRCISCMRCMGICPVGARGLSKLALLGCAKMLEKVCATRKENELFLPDLGV